MFGTDVRPCGRIIVAPPSGVNSSAGEERGDLLALAWVERRTQIRGTAQKHASVIDIAHCQADRAVVEPESGVIGAEAPSCGYLSSCL
jgi:hypothetical protein